MMGAASVKRKMPIFIFVPPKRRAPESATTSLMALRAHA
jgi:hypothetical protein